MASAIIATAAFAIYLFVKRLKNWEREMDRINAERRRWRNDD